MARDPPTEPTIVMMPATIVMMLVVIAMMFIFITMMLVTLDREADRPRAALTMNDVPAQCLRAYHEPQTTSHEHRSAMMRTASAGSGGSRWSAPW